ncbi:ATP-dependent DNA ligase [Cellulomonas endometrii]|uniref:ATP-dependent DNA ligase n=1 Tax=Cellulomonas endometrii TaxID=3036301 RepID=UPI0024AD47B0|nr:ATP-dependent DNA ligase [Cellulomonas endometrii]
MPRTPEDPSGLALARVAHALEDTVGLPGGTAWEPKWDGMRLLALADGPWTLLRSRHGADLTAAFPEVASAVADQVPPGTVLDGELVARRAGRVDFGALQRRVAAPDPAALTGLVPAAFIAFDVIQRERADLRVQPFIERRMALEELAAGWTDPLTTSALTGDVGVAARWFRDLAGSGVDGLVAKGLDQAYRPGTRDWRKVKHASAVDLVATAVMGPATQPGALLLALPVGRELVPVGRSGSLSLTAALALGRQITPLAPPGGAASAIATRIAPLVVEVSADVPWSGGALARPAQFLRARPELHPVEVDPDLALAGCG